MLVLLGMVTSCSAPPGVSAGSSVFDGDVSGGNAGEVGDNGA